MNLYTVVHSITKPVMALNSSQYCPVIKNLLHTDSTENMQQNDHKIPKYFNRRILKIGKDMTLSR